MHKWHRSAFIYSSSLYGVSFQVDGHGQDFRWGFQFVNFHSWSLGNRSEEGVGVGPVFLTS